MKAVVIKKFGDNEVLELARVPRPFLKAGEILVEIHATALNPADYKIRQGHLEEIFPTVFPRILGGDISGVVRELGPDANDFKIGDEVFFSNPLDKDGGYAEYVAVNQSIVAKKPASLDFINAASLPVVGLTAVQVLRDFSALKRGDKVLIHAGAGGVGSFAIQYAKAIGAIVYTTASKERFEYVKSLGADHVIDYKSQDFVEVSRSVGGMDVVFETLGGLNYPRSVMAVKEGGVVASIVNPPDSDTLALAERRRVRTAFCLLSASRSDLDLIASLVDSGKIRTTVSQVLPLEEVKKGHEILESGRAQGKLVLKIK